MPSRWRNRALSSLILLLGLALRIADPGIVKDFQARYFDLLQQIKPRVYAPAPVRVVDIDDASLQKLGQWPWPRTMLAELIGRLNAMGAAAIALDIVLAEPDRTSPGRVVGELGQAPAEVAQWIASLPDHDRVLAATIQGSRVVTGFALTSVGGGRAPASDAGWARAGDDPSGFVPAYGGAVATLPALEQAAAGNGSLNLVPDRDQTVRRVPLVVRYGDTLYPSLAAEALRVAQGAGSYLIKASGANGVLAFGEHTGISSIRIGAFAADTDASGAVWLYDTGPVAARSIPAWKVLDGSVPLNAVRGSIVFIGAGAAGLGDLKATPLSVGVLGTELDAQIAEQIILQNFLERPDWAAGAELIYLVLLGAALIFGLPRFGAAMSAVFTGAVFLAAFALSWYAFSQLHLIFDPLYPSIVALGVYLSASLLNQLQTESEKRRVRHAFSHYLPSSLIEELVKDPSKLRLGGELRQMSFLFSDIRGFTSVAEKCKSRPDAITEIVNRFTTRMTEAIFKTGGTIDKYMGDCVMAFWNAPVTEKDHARRACEAALAMRQALGALNSDLASEASAVLLAGGERLNVRLEAGIGINTGDCIVGNLGSDTHFNYSVIGDAVNLASRLEGESKVYGVPIVIGEETERLIPGFATLELDIVAVKGKREEVRVFTLLGDATLGADPAFLDFRARHVEMLAAYRARDWDEARTLIARCEGFNAELAPLYELYRARIAAFEREPASTPLPEIVLEAPP
ncbi:MAG TPA: adenylate/guanylate cyclase domain-containing protein [Stellaceae bacterium]|nr:adenylate/guanylate cyclase domain-containing protein [Stellaceae bacterium]